MDYHKQRFAKMFTAIIFTRVKTKQNGITKLFLSKSLYINLIECIVIKIVSIKNFNVVKMLVPQSCLTLRDHMDCSPPGFSVYGILQARILEWVAIPFFSGSSIFQEIFTTQGQSPALQHCRKILYCLSPQKSLNEVELSI